MAGGGIGALAAFSFHETKNISSGEGGCLMINDPLLVERAEILWEKGTDRAAYFRGEKNRYQWQELGSSFLPSEITAALLWAQLEDYDTIQKKRKLAWIYYQQCLPDFPQIYQKPQIPDIVDHNGHGYFLVLRGNNYREKLQGFLEQEGILALTHYEPLHLSPYYLAHYPMVSLPVTEKVANRLLRLPLFNDITQEEQDRVIAAIKSWKGTLLDPSNELSFSENK